MYSKSQVEAMLNELLISIKGINKDQTLYRRTPRATIIATVQVISKAEKEFRRISQKYGLDINTKDSV